MSEQKGDGREMDRQEKNIEGMKEASGKSKMENKQEKIKGLNNSLPWMTR